MHLHSPGRSLSVAVPVMGRLTSLPIPDVEERGDYVVYDKGANLEAFGGDLNGYAGLLSPYGAENPHSSTLPRVYGCQNLSYLDDGDIILLQPSGIVNVLYRRSSHHNTILATERCNSLCLMCSQPPRREDDSYRVRQILRLIELIDPSCLELGVTGGEPTLLGDDFLTIIQKCKDRLPTTAVHVLTNGRLFKERGFAGKLGAIGHPDLMLGIPLYSDIDEQHDYVVQARGAFDETVLGLYNLAEVGVRMEIRVVIHALTYRRLPQLAEFIYRNFPFASHVALMGMEMFGYVHLNLATLWIDPVDYQAELENATVSLALRGMNVSIYNHQLCTIPRSIWPFTRKSISDWKNVYLDACGPCGVRLLCGGFFQSATKKHSRCIKPLKALDAATHDVFCRYIGV